MKKNRRSGSIVIFSDRGLVFQIIADPADRQSQHHGVIELQNDFSMVIFCVIKVLFQNIKLKIRPCQKEQLFSIRIRQPKKR
jgi:hypothetical protein